MFRLVEVVTLRVDVVGMGVQCCLMGVGGWGRLRGGEWLVEEGRVDGCRVEVVS